jgi:DNA polymerase-1
VEGVDTLSPVIRTHTRTHTHTHVSEYHPTLHTLHNPPPPAETHFEPSTDPPQPSTPPADPPQLPSTATGTVAFDLEGGSADELFTYRPHDERGYVRLAGSLTAGGAPVITGAPALLERLAAAGEITGHNILGFDLPALAWHCGADFEALAAKAKDTELIARQAWPPRSREGGHSADGYGLDAVAQRLGIPGKTDDLARLKRRHGGYDKIPLDDPEYLSYLEGDLAATAAVSAMLGNDAYTVREHKLATLAGRMTLNGFLVDVPLLEQRIAQGQERKAAALGLLHDGWGLPLTRTLARGRGKARHEVTEELDSPLSAESGREWLAGVLEGYGVTVPRTPKQGKPAVGDEQLRAIAADPACPQPLRQLIACVKIVVGTRTVYQTAADCLAPDGRVHPGNSFRQASGRWSVTNPGLTVFGKHGGRHAERDIFVPDPGHVLLCFDLKQVDMRAMAGHCGDPAYMALFAPGRDAHAEIAAQVGIKRQDAKAIGHGWNYGLGANRMIRNGLDEALVRKFIAGMTERFPVLIAWREEIRAAGKAGDVLDNGFGRRMACDPERAYTVAPALMGQGGARDIMGECLLRLDRSLWPLLRVMVHDEIVCSVPKEDAVDVARQVTRAMTWTWRNVPILCDLSGGSSWGEASAK